jgi:hypothetical protein
VFPYSSSRVKGLRQNGDRRLADSKTTIPWQTLGTFSITGNTLNVVLNNNAKANVQADMVRLVPVTPNVSLVAAMVATRDTAATTVDAAIASQYSGHYDSRHNLLEEIASTRDLVHRLRRLRGTRGR